MNAVKTAEKGARSTLGRSTPRRPERKTELYESGELRLAKILARCIDAERKGRSVEEMLARHPAEADELRPLLEIVGMLRERHRAALLDEEDATPR